MHLQGGHVHGKGCLTLPICYYNATTPTYPGRGCAIVFYSLPYCEKENSE
jgi:hypothetical protein